MLGTMLRNFVTQSIAFKGPYLACPNLYFYQPPLGPESLAKVQLASSPSLLISSESEYDCDKSPRHVFLPILLHL